MSTSTNLFYSDIHCHLTDQRFADDLDVVIEGAEQAGLKYIVVNGLEHQTNRQVLAMANKYQIVQPALGIYPTEAIASVANFSIADELTFIDQQAKQNLLAIGECGLDAHLVGEETFAEQEQVFEQLCNIALTNDLPLIVHSRKREQRVADIVIAHGLKRVDFHCFSGRVKLAQRLADDHGYWFSIPANSRVNSGFQRMMELLPIERILTETDAPYLAPIRGERNEPKNVVLTVQHLAEIRQLSIEAATIQLGKNFHELFQISKL